MVYVVPILLLAALAGLFVYAFEMRFGNVWHGVALLVISAVAASILTWVAKR